MPREARAAAIAAEALEGRRLLSGGASFGHLGVVAGEAGVAAAYFQNLRSQDPPDRGAETGEYQAAGPGGQSAGRAQRIVERKAARAQQVDEEDDVEDSPESGGTGASGGTPGAQFFATGIPPEFATVAVSRAGEAQPLVLRAAQAVGRFSEAGAFVAMVGEVAPPPPPPPGLALPEGARVVGAPPLLELKASVMHAVTFQSARAVLATLATLRASEEAILPAAERVTRAIGATFMGSAAAVAPTALGVRWSDAMVVFGDALAGFAHESAAVGTLVAAATATATPRHTRAWAVTIAVLAVDAILIARSYTSRRRTSTARASQTVVGPNAAGD